MQAIADILLVLSAVSAAAYCIVLSRRLRRFTDLEKGVGGAIAVLSAQVDSMTTALKAAQSSAVGSADQLDKLTQKADGAARRLELMVAAMHDIPESPKAAPAELPEEKSPEPTENKDSPQPEEEPEPLFLSRRNLVPEAAE